MATAVQAASQSYFTIKPNDIGLCVFDAQAFWLNDVVHISEVEMIARLKYQFYVTLDKQRCNNKVLTFWFESKKDALLAQRELCRAYTGTGEFGEADDLQA